MKYSTSAKYWRNMISEPSKKFKEFTNAEKKLVSSTLKKDKKIIDVGCGEGREIEYFLKFNPRYILGIDHNKKVLTNVRKKFRKNANIDFKLCDATKIPVKDDFFDYATLIGLYSNLGKKKEKALKELNRVLKNGALVVISAYNEDAFGERMKYYDKVKIPIRKIVGTTVYFPKRIGDSISEQFYKKDLERDFKKAGFEVMKIFKKGVGYVAILRKKSL